MEAKTKAKSVPFRCPTGKEIKRFFLGTIHEYEKGKDGSYVETGKKEVIYVCPSCDPNCEQFQSFGWCQFTDGDNLRAFHE